MFNVTADLLRSVLILSQARETSSAWTVFMRELGKIRDQHVSENLHFVPSPDDHNARTRKDILNGVAISLDILFHAFDNPLSLIEDINNAKKQAEEGQSFDPS